MKKITISKDEYISLLIDSEILGRLESGGVDNWEWYSESITGDGQECLDVLRSRLENEFSGEA